VGVRERMVDEIWKLSADLSASHRGARQPRARLGGGDGATERRPRLRAAVRQNFTARVEDIFRAFQREVRDAVKDEGWDGNDDTDVARLQWSFAGALLYAVTVTTTIGI